MIEFDCTCDKKKHRAPIKGYEISRAAVKTLPEFLNGYKKVLIVADERTYEAAGKAVEKTLKSLNIFDGLLILKCDVLPNSETLGNILIHIHNPAEKSELFTCSPLPDFLLAVGSGTINDCCRLVSYRLGIPYGVVGTAPSMDGYFSAGSPILFGGGKYTIQCTTPEFVIADLDIMSGAPYPMLLAGIGDMFGKVTAILDWELAREYSGEYFCKKIAADAMSAVDKCLKSACSMLNREPSGINVLMESLMTSGLSMVYTGNSRPASGSEHIIAHAWELDCIERGEKPVLHGLLVCEATRLIIVVFRLLMSETEDARLINLISKYTHHFDAVEEFCKKSGFQNSVTDKERILKGFYRALTLRDRFTVLTYLRDNGKFDEYAKRAAETFLV